MDSMASNAIFFNFPTHPHQREMMNPNKDTIQETNMLYHTPSNNPESITQRYLPLKSLKFKDNHVHNQYSNWEINELQYTHSHSHSHPKISIYRFQIKLQISGNNSEPQVHYHLHPITEGYDACYHSPTTTSILLFATHKCNTNIILHQQYIDVPHPHPANQN